MIDDKELQDIANEIRVAAGELLVLQGEEWEEKLELIKATTIAKALGLIKKYTQEHDELKRLVALQIYHSLIDFLETKYDH